MALLSDAQLAANDGALFLVNTNDVKLVSKDELGTAWTWMVSFLWGTPDPVIVSNQLAQKILWMTSFTLAFLGNILTAKAVVAGRHGFLGFYI